MNRNIAPILVLVALLMIELGLAAPAAASQLPAVIALFGDSTTVGYVPPKDHNGNYYPAKDAQGRPFVFEDRFANGTTTRGVPTIHLNELLNNGIPKRPSIVTNWGIGGTPTAGADNNGIGRIDNTLSTVKSSHNGNAYYVLILYGSNDFGVGLSNNDTGENIKFMIDVARSRGFEPIVGTVAPRSDRDMGPLNSVIRSAAASKGVPLVDHYQMFLDVAPPNGHDLLTSEKSVTTGQPVRLHPFPDTYRMMAQLWFDQSLKSLIKGKGMPIAAIQLLLLNNESGEEVMTP